MKYTITSLFLVPTLGIGSEKLNENGFINAYIKDIKREIEYDENHIFLLFKPNNMDKFKLFLDEEYYRTFSIIEDYDYDGGYVVLVYKLNSNFKSDFDLIKKGKYSKVSDQFKALFPKIKITNPKPYVKKEEVSLQWRIFNKSEDLKEYWESKLYVDFTDDMETWSIFDENKEVLDIDKIEQLI